VRDGFEGADYVRVLTRATLADGTVVEAYVYALAAGETGDGGAAGQGRIWPSPAIQASTTLSEVDDRSVESPISVFDLLFLDDILKRDGSMQVFKLPPVWALGTTRRSLIQMRNSCKTSG
jgi:hypothetical protein